MKGGKARCLRVPREGAEGVRQALKEMGALRSDLLIARDGDSVWLPLREDLGPAELRKAGGLGVVEEKLLEPSKRVPKNYRELLDLPEDIMELLPRAYDVVGKVIVLKIPSEVSKYRAEIGEALLKSRAEAVSVAWDRGVKGEDRIRDLEVIAGLRDLETVHIENGLRFAVDPSKVYYSPRLATERARVAGLVKKGEVVADLFAGIGPFSITIAKRALPSAVYAVDINPAAIDYLKRNIKLNRATGVVPMLGDIRNVAGKLPKADRLIMNLPHSAFDFIPVALGMARPGATVHLYDIIEPEKRAERKERLASAVEKEGKKATEIACRLVRGYSTLESHFVFDIQLD